MSAVCVCAVRRGRVVRRGRACGGRGADGFMAGAVRDEWQVRRVCACACCGRGARLAWYGCSAGMRVVGMCVLE